MAKKGKKQLNKISFIFPIYNEEKLLKKQLSVFLNFVKGNLKNNYEVLLVDNGSQDRSWTIIRQLERKHPQLRALRINQASYGRAMKHGLLSATGDIAFVLDLDNLATDFISQSIPLLKKYNAVIGSKTLAGSRDERPFRDKLRTQIFNGLIVKLCQYPGTDSHGVRAFVLNQSLVKNLNRCVCKYELLDTELLIRMARQKQNIKEIPVDVQEIRPSRYQKLRRYKLVILDLIRLASACLGHYHSVTRKGERFKPQSITADDFASSVVVNQAIINQAQAGNVEVISVMSNLIGKKQVQLLLRQKLQVDYSLHFNLTRGKALSPPSSIPSLVDQYGQFHPLQIFLFKLLLKQINQQEVEQELKAQLERLKKLGIKAKYLDSEQHIHLFTPIWSSCVHIATTNKLTIRSPQSTIEHLKLKPFRLLVFKTFSFLCTTQKPTTSSTATYNALIRHPGNNYD